MCNLIQYLLRQAGSSFINFENFLWRSSLDYKVYIYNLEEIGKCNSTSPIFKNFFYRTTLLWNQLLQDIRTMPSVINVFKTHYIRGLV